MGGRVDGWVGDAMRVSVEHGPEITFQRNFDHWLLSNDSFEKSIFYDLLLLFILFRLSLLLLVLLWLWLWLLLLLLLVLLLQLTVVQP